MKKVKLALDGGNVSKDTTTLTILQKGNFRQKLKEYQLFQGHVNVHSVHHIAPNSQLCNGANDNLEPVKSYCSIFTY